MKHPNNKKIDWWRLRWWNSFDQSKVTTIMLFNIIFLKIFNFVWPFPELSTTSCSLPQQTVVVIVVFYCSVIPYYITSTSQFQKAIVYNDYKCSEIHSSFHWLVHKWHFQLQTSWLAIKKKTSLSTSALPHFNSNCMKSPSKLTDCISVFLPLSTSVSPSSFSFF